jgi:hypothetical protein
MILLSCLQVARMILIQELFLCIALLLFFWLYLPVELHRHRKNVN